MWDIWILKRILFRDTNDCPLGDVRTIVEIAHGVLTVIRKEKSTRNNEWQIVQVDTFDLTRKGK